MEKVHRIAASWLRGLRQGDSWHRRGLLPPSPPEREPFDAIIEPFHLLMVHSPAFPSQPHTSGDTRTSLTLGNFSDPRPQGLTLLPPTTIPERVPIERGEAAHSSLTEPNAFGHQLGRGSFRLGRYQFFAVSPSALGYRALAPPPSASIAGFRLPAGEAFSRR